MEKQEYSFSWPVQNQEVEQNETEGPLILFSVTLLESFHLKLVTFIRPDCARLVFGAMCALIHERIRIA